MIYLIKTKKILASFIKIYILLSIKSTNFFIYILLFLLNLTEKILEIFYINKVIYVKFLIVEINFTSKLIKIII